MCALQGMHPSTRHCTVGKSEFTLSHSAVWFDININISNHNASAESSSYRQNALWSLTPVACKPIITLILLANKPGRNNEEPVMLPRLYQAQVNNRYCPGWCHCQTSRLHTCTECRSISCCTSQCGDFIQNWHRRSTCLNHEWQPYLAPNLGTSQNQTARPTSPGRNAKQGGYF